MFSLLRRRAGQLIHVLKGYLFKWKIDVFGVPKKVTSLDKRSSDKRLIVSLTSYGRRVSDVVYYTLLSLLLQSKKPNLIVLWLSEEEWNEDNIPSKLKSLIKYGIEIKFCKDLRSYKKLVPSLKSYPDDIIITVDDDVIYRKNLLKDLYDASIKFPNAIICNKACYPYLEKNGEFASYNEWEDKNHYVGLCMPLGVTGVLYPPHSLFKDVTDDSIFLKLAPLADDLWFWIMAILQNTHHEVIGEDKSEGGSFDDLYQYFHKYSALTHQNSKENKNDTQIKAILQYYNLAPNDLLKL